MIGKVREFSYIKPVGTLDSYLMCSVYIVFMRNSVHLSIRLSVTRVDQSKTMQSRITISSPTAV